MNNWWAKITDVMSVYLGLSPEVFGRVLATLFVAALYFLSRTLSNRLSERRIEDAARRFVIRKTFSYLLGLIAAMMIIWLWVGSGQGILTYLGILSAGLAIALQEPLANFAGWIFIVVTKPFAIGDRVEIDSIAGDVIDTRLFQFSLIEIKNWVNADQSTGRIVQVPNGLIFKKALVNYTIGFNFIWNEIPVMITFESNWRKAEEILKKIAQDNSHIEVESAQRQLQRASQKYLVLYMHLTPIVYLTVAASGVTLTIRYLCDPRKRRSSETAIWKSVLTEFGAEPDIDLAYPTQRFFLNQIEGKPQAGGPAENGEMGSGLDN